MGRLYSENLTHGSLLAGSTACSKHLSNVGRQFFPLFVLRGVQKQKAENDLPLIAVK